MYNSVRSLDNTVDHASRAGIIGDERGTRTFCKFSSYSSTIISSLRISKHAANFCKRHRKSRMWSLISRLFCAVANCRQQCVLECTVTYQRRNPRGAAMRDAAARRHSCGTIRKVRVRQYDIPIRQVSPFRVPVVRLCRATWRYPN